MKVQAAEKQIGDGVGFLLCLLASPDALLALFLPCTGDSSQYSSTGT